MRTYYGWNIFDSSDKSYHITQLGMWASAEAALGILISCVPVLPRFWQHFSSKTTDSFTFLRFRLAKHSISSHSDTADRA